MFEITLEKGKKPLSKTKYHVEVEKTNRGIYYTLVDGLGGENATIQVRDNKIVWFSGANRYLLVILKVYPELDELQFSIE